LFLKCVGRFLGKLHFLNQCAVCCWGRTVGTASHARCTTNGMCAKNSTYACRANKQ